MMNATFPIHNRPAWDIVQVLSFCEQRPVPSNGTYIHRPDIGDGDEITYIFFNEQILGLFTGTVI